MGATKDFYSYGSRIVIFNEKEKITGEILGQPVDGFFTISIGGGIFGTISVPEKLLRYDIQSGFFVYALRRFLISITDTAATPA